MGDVGVLPSPPGSDETTAGPTNDPELPGVAMGDTFNIDGLLDALAEKVAVRLRAGMEQNGSGAGIRPRLLTVP